MKVLAQAVVFLMEVLTTADEPGIDWQACGDITNNWNAVGTSSWKSNSSFLQLRSMQTNLLN